MFGDSGSEWLAIPAGDPEYPRLNIRTNSGERFEMNMGGMDYYAQEASLDVADVQALRRELETWLAARGAAHPTLERNA